MALSHDHINFIIRDLTFRGLIVDELRDEIVDHVCTAVEAEMENGVRFITAYGIVLRTFGSTRGLHRTQTHFIQSTTQKKMMMIRSYFTIAWRSLRKHSFFFLVNVAGLAIGIAACTLILLYIAYELGYDRQHVNDGRIFRVDNEITFGGNNVAMTKSPAPFAHTLQAEYPEIENTVRFCSYGTYLVKTADGQENIKEENVMWTDSTFFTVFSVPVIEGNAQKALAQPGGVAVSRHIAEKYYPGRSALGQPLVLDNKYNATITAVYENIPAQSHFHFDILISLAGDWLVAQEARSTVFLGNNFITYLLLKPGSDAKALESKLEGFVAKYVGPEFARIRGEAVFSMEKFRASGNLYKTTLMPLNKIHLYSDKAGEFEANGSIAYVYLLTAISFVILVIACINFMNLATARSGSRAREVGVRKVMGSLRIHLVRQFLTESMIVTAFAFIIGLALVVITLPFFNSLSGKYLVLPWSSPMFYLTVMCALVMTGLLAGLYPSFFLSAFKPAQALKASFHPSRNGFLRSSLVVFQFTVSIALIVAALVINRQLRFIQTARLGFDKEQLLIVRDAYALRPNVQVFKNEALRLSNVISCTVSGFIPSEGPEISRNDMAFWRTDLQPLPSNFVSIQNWRVDPDYLKTFKLELIAGRDFSAARSTDSDAVLLNEEAVARFGMGDDAVGRQISTFAGRRKDGSPDLENIRSYTVIGVIRNFHFSSMQKAIEPLGLFLGQSDGFYSIRLSGNDIVGTVNALRSEWKKIDPDQPFQYSFFNDHFARMYSQEEKMEKIFSLFAALAICIACLGLFALTAFVTEQRTKEIGIRKVLGASIPGIIILLTRDLAKLLVISFVIAAPLAYYATDKWLHGYAYKAEIGTGVYIFAGAITLIVALGTMSFQSVKAAAGNPVDALKAE